MWIHTIAKFRNGEIPDVEWDLMSEEDQEENCVDRQFRFKPEELIVYNEAMYNRTTLRFKSGYEVTVCNTIQEMEKLIEG